MNENSEDQEEMIFRIGINMGDVIVTKDNLFGDAVNVAARLESSAMPDGICISKSVFDLINLKIKVSLAYLFVGREWEWLWQQIR